MFEATKWVYQIFENNKSGISEKLLIINSYEIVIAK
jgi:hypothetical protein